MHCLVAPSLRVTHLHAAMRLTFQRALMLTGHSPKPVNTGPTIAFLEADVHKRSAWGRLATDCSHQHTAFTMLRAAQKYLLRTTVVVTWSLGHEKFLPDKPKCVSTNGEQGCTRSRMSTVRSNMDTGTHSNFTSMRERGTCRSV